MMIYCTKLADRGILKVSGPDRLAFLQGLVTNDLAQLTCEKSLYSLLLTAQGKHFFDLFFLVVGDEWWVEADRSRLDDLKKRLSLYKLRSNVTLDIDLDQHIFALYGNNVAQAFDLPLELGQTQHTVAPIYVDPRLAELGLRLVTDDEHFGALQQSHALTLVEADDYRYHRYGLGVPETGAELLVDKSIPLENGMDELKAINWTKGCYMGQELTSRTRYRGLVRKRLFPVTLSGPVKSETPIMAGAAEVGQWRGICRDRGLALIRLEALGKPLTCGDVSISINQPPWMQLSQ